CNHLFDTADGSQFFNDGNLVFSESKSPDNKAATHFDGAPTPPVWLSAEEISESDFAKLADQKIVECCTKTDTGQTRLQIFDKNKPDTLRNVSFRDFAILARTRKEFPFIETELQNLGIPYVRYKDDNLFNSRECMQWIALFKAIDADDFTAYNRRILNEALLTDFFDPLIVSERIECGLSNRLIKTVCPKLHTVNLDIYDDPQRRERQQLAKYHALARKFRWAEMLECIYQESDIETRTANDLSKLQALAKFQQIGNYSIEYLYANRCTLQELVKHLDNLQKKADETTDKDGNLVARGTDFDAVQLMTIHASKGLEFPIVIGVGGFRRYYDQAKGPYTYHEIVDDRYHKYLGFDKSAKKKQKIEDIKEWKRLFYVAYTRASALLILPRYDKVCNDFLKLSLNAFATHKENAEYICTLMPNNTSLDDLKRDVTGALNANTNQISSVDDSNSQKDAIQALQNSLGKKSLIQHSYSTLASKVQLKKVEITPDTPDCSTPCPECAPDDADFDLAEPEIHDANGKCADIASDGTDADTPRYILEPNVDLTPKPIAHKPDYDTAYPPILDTNYPRGKQLGNAIHEVFENLDFAKAQARLEDFQTDPEVKALIEQTYAKYGLPLSKHSEWHAITAQFVWRTLNAKLPVIEGACDAQDAFALKDLPENSHRAEVEFYLEGALIHNDDMPKTGEYYSKGFIDLLFMREVNGTKRYSILDWKSDRMESGEYANPDALKAKVDREYAVQRVLYSYCLIQWLKQFYPNLKPDEIFDQHFGGIYYAFVRGTANGTANGIYAQTWDSYQTLKNNYKEIHKLMFAPSQKENPNND
ncbi:MAG: exodeoxyribonuclease V, partial [Proteobacteria bacterium]|nr:exodeoxyribonuclease V [Pseudomonadota bacterium]